MLVPLALLGAILPWHPFDAPYQWFVRRWINGPAIPPYRAPRRFACAVATLWLGAIVLAMLKSHHALAELLIGLFIITAAMPVLFDFCVPSFIYQIFTTPFGGTNSVEFTRTGSVVASRGDTIVRRKGTT